MKSQGAQQRKGWMERGMEINPPGCGVCARTVSWCSPVHSSWPGPCPQPFQKPTRQVSAVWRGPQGPGFTILPILWPSLCSVPPPQLDKACGQGSLGRHRPWALEVGPGFWRGQPRIWAASLLGVPVAGWAHEPDSQTPRATSGKLRTRSQ